MRRVPFVFLMILFIFIGVTLAGCGSSAPTKTQYIIHYDGDPAGSSGNGSPADWECLVYFNSAELSPYVGGQLVGVRIYDPDSANPTWTYTVRIYDTGTSTAPGTQLYSHDHVLNHNSWNDITLTTPINITSGREIWAGYYIHTTSAWPISYDNNSQVAGVNFINTIDTGLEESAFSHNFNIRLIVKK